ncbi:ankyrin repeat-containing domain protein [Russula compacta]|nr:ankyrin repeat-containing domain protein [Russula compacta]
MRLLLEFGADVNSVMRHGWTPLHLASSKDKLEAVRLLLRHGANADALDELGGTELPSISRPLSSHHWILIRGGGHVWDKLNMTPLKTASILGHHDIVQLLLEHGAEAE